MGETLPQEVQQYSEKRAHMQRRIWDGEITEQGLRGNELSAEGAALILREPIGQGRKTQQRGDLGLLIRHLYTALVFELDQSRTPRFSKSIGTP